MTYGARQQRLLKAHGLIAVMVVLEIPGLPVCLATPQVGGGQTRRSERNTPKEKTGTRRRSKPENGLLAALMLAAEEGDTATVVALLSKGADANGRGKDGLTPLMFAVLHNSPAVVKLLLDRGAALDLRYDGGLTALMIKEARNFGSLEDFATALHKDLTNILSGVPETKRGIGIHLMGYERVGDYWVPELFLLSNYEDTTYSKLCCLHKRRETYHIAFNDQTYERHGEREYRYKLHGFWLRVGCSCSTMAILLCLTLLQNLSFKS